MKRALTFAVILLIGGTVAASQEDDLTSLSYISYMERYATIQPANETDQREAVINMPLLPGDRIDTARQARMEVQLADGSTVWLDEYTSVSLDALALSRGDSSERTVLFIAGGTGIIQIPSSALMKLRTRVDSQSATVYLEKGGLYRVESVPGGGLRVGVWQGSAEAATPAGGVEIRQGTAARIEAGRVENENVRLEQGDDFAQWVAQRRQPGEERRDNLYVDSRYQSQAAVLDSYGSWVYLDDIGSWGWQPSVDAGWTPYTAGRWYWTPVGWNWISYEPWGWMPYHYGTWNFSLSFGWVWNYGPYWGPAWVDWVWWPGYVGWCPRGYYDNWYWNRRYGRYGGSRAHPRPLGRVRGDRGSRPVPGRRFAGQRQPIPASRFTMDLRGDVDLRKIDPRGWNVVRSSDFSSPHLSRLVRPGQDVFPTVRGVKRGVVSSGPLVTPSPARISPNLGLAHTFGEIRRKHPVDVTPILSRSANQDPRTLERLARPTSPERLAREVSAGRPVLAPMRSAGNRNVVSGQTPRTREVSPNRFRPQVAGESRPLQRNAGAAPAGRSARVVGPESNRNVHRDLRSSPSSSGRGPSIGSGRQGSTRSFSGRPLFRRYTGQSPTRLRGPAPRTFTEPRRLTRPSSARPSRISRPRSTSRYRSYRPRYIPRTIRPQRSYRVVPRALAPRVSRPSSHRSITVRPGRH